MRNITKIRHSVKAISPVISVLLMIAIAVIASLLAYAWVVGYIGGQTQKTGNTIEVQSYTSQGNLILYIQNTGQGTVHLKQDGSVYVNDVLKTIVAANDETVQPGALIPLHVGQTVKIEVNYDQYKSGDKIKVVTVEGTTMRSQALLTLTQMCL
jgi:flagellin-like protein